MKSIRFKETGHQEGLSHAWAKYIKASDQGGDKRALVFTGSLDFFFRKERDYNKENLIPEDRGGRRQSLEVKKELIKLRINPMVEPKMKPLLGGGTSFGVRFSHFSRMVIV